MYEWNENSNFQLEEGNALLVVFTDLFTERWEPLFRLVNTDEQKGTSLSQWPKMWQPVPCANS